MRCRAAPLWPQRRGCTAQLDDLFAFLSRNGTEEIVEAQDMDKYNNQGVSTGASKVYLLARKYGMPAAG